MRHASLSLQVPAAAADVHAIWRSARGAVVILLRGGLPLKCEERFGIGDRRPMERGGEGGESVSGEGCSEWPVRLSVHITRLSPPR